MELVVWKLTCLTLLQVTFGQAAIPGTQRACATITFTTLVLWSWWRGVFNISFFRKISPIKEIPEIREINEIL
jgi:hypothetical protein